MAVDSASLGIHTGDLTAAQNNKEVVNAKTIEIFKYSY